MWKIVCCLTKFPNPIHRLFNIPESLSQKKKQSNEGFPQGLSRGTGLQLSQLLRCQHYGSQVWPPSLWVSNSSSLQLGQQRDGSFLFCTPLIPHAHAMPRWEWGHSHCEKTEIGLTRNKQWWENRWRHTWLCSVGKSKNEKNKDLS